MMKMPKRNMKPKRKPNPLTVDLFSIKNIETIRHLLIDYKKGIIHGEKIPEGVIRTCEFVSDMYSKLEDQIRLFRFIILLPDKASKYQSGKIKARDFIFMIKDHKLGDIGKGLLKFTEEELLHLIEQ